MCLIIDTCTFFSVFDEKSQAHKRFSPIAKWLFFGEGKMIYGGTKYKQELGGKRVLRILVELERKGKLVKVPTTEVDKFAISLKKIVPDSDFDDEHIVALVAVSRCTLVCTDDKRAIHYLKRQDLYPKDVKRPKIYKSDRNADLCCDKHMVKICQ